MTDETATTLAEELNAAIERNDGEAMAQLVHDIPGPDFAEFLDEQPLDVSEKLLSRLPLEQRAHAFAYFRPAAQQELAERLGPSELVQLIARMNADERADLFNLLDDRRRARIMRDLAQKEREELRLLTSFDEGTAGSLMTSDYVALPARSTVSQAFDIIRATAPSAETVYDLYCVDYMGRLLGTVSLRKLILSRSSQRLERIMNTDIISAQATTDAEEAAQLVARYDLRALPVIDDGARLVGIITYDDAMDVAEQQATEDIQLGASVQPLDDEVGKARLTALYKSRVVWLVLLVFGNLFSGAGLAWFEDILASHVALVFFLPLLIGSGGNAGAQSATLIVRGLATNDVRMQDWLRLAGRETLIAGALGLTMALAIAPIGLWRGGEQIALVVALAMVTVVVFGSLMGLLLPFVLRRLDWDPATASGPLVATLIDASGVLIYFGIASLVFRLWV